MRGQGRKESLSDSRDLDGSYDQLTGESVDGGSLEGGYIPSPQTLMPLPPAKPLPTLCPIPRHPPAVLGPRTLEFKALGPKVG